MQDWKKRTRLQGGILGLDTDGHDFMIHVCIIGEFLTHKLGDTCEMFHYVQKFVLFL